jgi:hypothetical protein
VGVVGVAERDEEADDVGGVAVVLVLQGEHRRRASWEVAVAG